MADEAYDRLQFTMVKLLSRAADGGGTRAFERPVA